MKKLLGIIVLNLLLCVNANARISILSEDMGGTWDWLSFLIVCVPFFAYVFYSHHRNKKKNEEETERQIRIFKQIRAKPKGKIQRNKK